MKDKKDFSSRIYWLDNAKFILITAVILAHFLPGPNKNFIPQLSYDNYFFQTVEVILFLFMMQAFSFISGLLSRAELTADYIQKSFFQLMIPYFIIATLLELFSNNEVSPSYLLIAPPVMWYLLALFIWRIALPVALQIRYPLSILIAFAVAIGVGSETNIGEVLSLSRVFNFFPFFLLGHLYGKKLISLHFKYQTLFGLMIFVGAFLACWFYFPYQKISVGVLELRDPYNLLGMDKLSGAITRLIIILVSLILTFAFFLLVPKKETFYSSLGTRSIYAYILHVFITAGLYASGIYNNPSITTQFILIPGAAILTSFILCSRWVEGIFSYIIYPEIAKKIFVPVSHSKNT